MKTRILSLLIVASLFISLTSFAQPTKEGSRRNINPDQKAMKQKRFAQQKGERQNFFTDEQQEAIKKFRMESSKKIKPLKNELGELMARQKTLTTADNAELKAINKNIDKMSEVKTEIAKIMAAQHQQMRSLLTEEQLLKFDAMKGKRGQKKGSDFNRKRMDSRNQIHSRRGA